MAHEANEKVLLAVHMTAEGFEYLTRHGYYRCHRELEHATIERLCRAQTSPVPYQWPFVSITVYRGLHVPEGAPAAIYGLDPSPRSASCGYTVFLKNEVVVPKLTVVCSGDFRTTAYNASKRRWKTSDRSSFTRLIGLDFEEKIAALCDACSRVGENAYAEARLHGHIIWSEDVDVSRTKTFNA